MRTIVLDRMSMAQTKVTGDFAMQLDSRIRILLVDDNELFRAGVKSLISANEIFAIVGEAKDRAQAVNLTRRERPHIVLINIELRSTNGLDIIPDVIAARKNCRVAVLTDSRDPEVHRRAMSMGAIGIISKEDPPESLLNALKRVHAGSVWLDRLVAAKMLGDLSRGQKEDPNGKNIATLTKREREVIRLAGEGLDNKQIGERLFISMVTVHHHMTSIYSKLAVKNRLELIVYAYKNRLADLPR
jgi:two-component system nitrate/nitrite response regulator NarL